MQLVKPCSNESWWILDHFFRGRADFLMQKTEHDRMEAVATYLAQQIKVKNKSKLKNSRSDHVNAFSDLSKNLSFFFKS